MTTTATHSSAYLAALAEFCQAERCLTHFAELSPSSDMALSYRFELDQAEAALLEFPEYTVRDLETMRDVTANAWPC